MLIFFVIRLIDIYILSHLSCRNDFISCLALLGHEVGELLKSG